MTQLLDFLTRYSNLILAIITGIYVVLTWKMISEMRLARASQADANLIASPIPLGPVSAQVQLQNAGPGPASDIEVSISLDPPLDTSVKTWRRPALLVGQMEHFLLPTSNIAGLRELAEKHGSLVITLKWKNIFGQDKSFSAVHNLHDLAEGWYNAGHLIPPDNIATRFKEAVGTLDKMQRDLERIAQRLDK